MTRTERRPPSHRTPREEDDAAPEEKLSLPLWIIPVAAVLAVVAVTLLLRGRRQDLEGEIARLEEERRRLEEVIEHQKLTDPAYGVQCPPVVELDPGWAHRMPWGPGRQAALPLLEGGGAEVRLLDVDGVPGPTVSWNPELRVYDLPSREAVRRTGGFYLGVRVGQDRWALTLPSNWPDPLCEPWIACGEACDEDGCILNPRPDEVPPPASLPRACQGELSREGPAPAPPPPSSRTPPSDAA